MFFSFLGGRRHVSLFTCSHVFMMCKRSLQWSARGLSWDSPEIRPWAHQVSKNCQSFCKIWLVFGCIVTGTKYVLCSIFLRSTRLSSWISKIGRSNIMSWNLTYISKCSEISNFTTTAGFSPFFANFWLWSEGRKRKRILIVERCKQCANLLHVDKCCRMNICSQK